MDYNEITQMLNKYTRLLIVGPYPPPIGGVSVFIYRLNKLLNNSIVIDIKKEKVLRSLKTLFLDRYDAIHLNSFDIRLVLLLMVVKRIKKFDLIVTSHNPRLFQESNIFKRKVYKLFFKQILVLHAVGEHIIDDYKENGLLLPQKIIVESAFISPPVEDEDEILRTYPVSLSQFVKQHNPIVIANAYKIVFVNGIDLYGLDMCVELVLRLKNDFSELGFIFALADEKSNEKYIENVNVKIRELGLTNNFYFLKGQKELWPLFKSADLLVRPTSTDGTPISISEALHFNCTAIASDVCDRPNGTILFKNRDTEDLYKKTKKVLDD